MCVNSREIRLLALRAQGSRRGLETVRHSIIWLLLGSYCTAAGTAEPGAGGGVLGEHGGGQRAANLVECCSHPSEQLVGLREGGRKQGRVATGSLWSDFCEGKLQKEGLTIHLAFRALVLL